VYRDFSLLPVTGASRSDPTLLLTRLEILGQRQPDIAVGDVLGSCMFNLVILSLMDAVQPEPLSGRAHQSHALPHKRFVVAWDTGAITAVGLAVVGPFDAAHRSATTLNPDRVLVIARKWLCPLWSRRPWLKMTPLCPPGPSGAPPRVGGTADRLSP
jgi:hypothetical protein